MTNSTEIITIDDRNPVAWKLSDVLIITSSIILIIIGATTVLFAFRNSEISQLGENSQITITVSLGTGILEVVALIASVYVFGMRRRKLSWQDVGLHTLSPLWLKWSIAIGIIAIPISSFIALLAQYIFKLPLENPQIPFLVPTNINPAGMVAMFLVIGLLVPFAEELYFRGVIFIYFKRRLGFWVGAIISAAFFGIVHGELSVGIAAFLLGIILAWVYMRSNSLWAAVTIHAINNSFKVFLLYVLLSTGHLT